MCREIVVFDAQGTEIDWMDPYESHEDFGVYVEATQMSGEIYHLDIPPGGYYEVRERKLG